MKWALPEKMKLEAFMDKAFPGQRAKEEAMAKARQTPPDSRCYFGILSHHRCQGRAVRASTFYGFTTGAAWCERHGDHERNYPHGQIQIK